MVVVVELPQVNLWRVSVRCVTCVAGSQESQIKMESEQVWAGYGEGWLYTGGGRPGESSE